MSAKTTMALAGMMVILAAGLASAQTETKAGETNMAQNRVRNQVREGLQTRSQFRNGASGTVGAMFYDENGDGICDAIRDHDNDGIPNGQDADWKAPQDGTGYKGPARTPAGGGIGNGAGFRGGIASGNTAFRRGLGGQGGGTGVCDGTGPKGAGIRKGRG